MNLVAGLRRLIYSVTVSGLALVLVGLAPATAESAPGPPLRLAADPATGTAPVTIGTVPPVTGFPVTLDGVTHQTDAEGNARFDAPISEQELSDRVALNEAILPIDGQQVKVTANRLYPSVTTPRLALDLSYLVRFQFSDMEGEQVDDSLIKTLRVKGVTGAILDLPAHEASWLQGSRVIPTPAGLLVKQMDWSVQRVDYSGANVVNISQQRFLPAVTQVVPVKLLFYGLELQLRDAFFHFPYQDAVQLRYPDGHAERVPLDGDGRLRLPALPRGEYTLTPLGPGPGLARPMAVTRDQTLAIAFYSWLDISIVLGTILALAVGLAWGGRVRRRRDASHLPRGAHRRHRADPDAVRDADALGVHPAGGTSVNAAVGSNRCAG